MIAYILEHVFGFIIGGILGTILDWAIGVGFTIFVAVIAFVVLYYLIDNWDAVTTKIASGVKQAEGVAEQSISQVTSFLPSPVAGKPDPASDSSPTNGILAKVLLDGVDRGQKVVDANQTIAFADGRRVNQVYKVTDLSSQQPVASPAANPTSGAAAATASITK